MLLYNEICTTHEHIINLCDKVIEINYILTCQNILIDKNKTFVIYFCENHYDGTDVMRISFLDKENSLMNLLFSNNLRFELSIEFHKDQISDFCNERHGEYSVSIKN